MLVPIITAVALSVAIIFIVIRFVLPNVTKSMIDQFLAIAKTQLGAQNEDIAKDYENKKQAIEALIKELRTDLERNDERLVGAEKERVGSFREIKTELENQRKLTEQLRATTDGLSKVLSSNQMRGQWGEKVAQDLLSMNGFVKGLNYDANKEQDTGKRPDFTIYLPNKAKINVDAKFPYQNLKRMAETNDPSAKVELKKLFEKDVREKIRQVTTRDYINPEDNTVDFVILFIPNEMVFSFIYESMSEIWVEAMKQKVVLAGPFTFTAILRMVSQAYENFKYQKNVQKIIGHIRAFMTEFDKFNEEFAKIGERIDSLSRQFNTVNTTRTNQLVRSVEKIKLEETDTAQTPLLD